jgi:LPXTG-site transpeptidase (sortase) family protein
VRRNLIAGLLIAGGLALMASSVPSLLHLGNSQTDVAIQPIPALGDPLSPPHQHPRSLPGTGSNGAGPSQVVAYLSIPKLGIKSAPIYDRGVDGSGNMLIAKGYSITHFSYSAAIGAGNAVLYGHDDIEGSVFARLQELKVGDQLQVISTAGTPISYRVTARSIVAPTAVQILQPTSDVRLTIFTCWPTWVDNKRVVVTALPVSTN